MTSRGSSLRPRAAAVLAALAAAGSLAVAGAQQPPAPGGQKPTPPAGQTPAPPAAPDTPATPASPAAPAAPAAPAVPTVPAPTKAIVPVAASSVAAKPDQWIGEFVAMTGIVDASLGKLVFTVDQDKTKSGSDVLVIAHRMSDPVAVNTYVTVIGLLMKYDQAEIAGKSKAHAATELPADAVAKYSGKPVVLATSVVNDRMLDLARFIPPPMTPDEEALQKAMRGLPAASGEMRKGADASNAEMATKNVATLTAAFTEVETFMKKRGKTRRGEVGRRRPQQRAPGRKVGQERPVGHREDRRRLGRQCLRHLPHPLPRAPRGWLVPLQGRRDEHGAKPGVLGTGTRDRGPGKTDYTKGAATGPRPWPSHQRANGREAEAPRPHVFCFRFLVPSPRSPQALSIGNARS